MTEDEYRRKSDDAIIILTQRFNDFVERYDRDMGANNEWKRTTELELHSQSAALAEISPAYARGKWVIGLITVGSIGVAIKSFWSHLFWK
jgi:hypothetical protein